MFSETKKKRHRQLVIPKSWISYTPFFCMEGLVWVDYWWSTYGARLKHRENAAGDMSILMAVSAMKFLEAITSMVYHGLRLNIHDQSMSYHVKIIAKYHL